MSMNDLKDKAGVCRLCTREVSNNAINLYSYDSVERRNADRMTNGLELPPAGKEDGLSTDICELCNVRFKQLAESLEVYRIQTIKGYDNLAKKASMSNLWRVVDG